MLASTNSLLVNGTPEQHDQIAMIVGFVDDDIYKTRLRIRGVNVLGRRNDIPELVSNHDIGIIVFAIHNLTADDQSDVLDICNQTSARVVMMPDFMGNLTNVASILSSIQTVESRIKSNGIGLT